MSLIRWCTVMFACIVYVSIAACATNRATGPRFEQQLTPNVGETILYFYRPALPEAPSKFSSRIYVSDRLIGELDYGGYFVHRIAPGRYRVSLSEKENSDDLWLVTSEGASYFIKWDYVETLPWKGATHYAPLLTTVGASQAAQELQSCRKMQY